MQFQVKSRFFSLVLHIVSNPHYQSKHENFDLLTELWTEFLAKTKERIADFEVPELEHSVSFNNTCLALGTEMETAFLRNMEVYIKTHSYFPIFSILFYLM